MIIHRGLSNIWLLNPVYVRLCVQMIVHTASPILDIETWTIRVSNQRNSRLPLHIVLVTFTFSCSSRENGDIYLENMQIKQCNERKTYLYISLNNVFS